MAREVRTFAPVIPANTAKASPVTRALTMPARLVRKVRVRIPPGPAGQMGFALAAAGVRVLPWGADQWVVGDNEVLEVPLEGYIESGAWQLQGYNTGLYNHTVYVTFELDPPEADARLTVLTPLDLGA